MLWRISFLLVNLFVNLDCVLDLGIKLPLNKDSSIGLKVPEEWPSAPGAGSPESALF